MKKNMGVTDKRIRVFIAVLIFSLYYFNIIEGTLGMIGLGLALVFVLTSFISFCPLYLPFRISTIKKK
ncbi:YgaP family membrane protein [Flavobacterium sp. RSSA_27]|uniref:YgaP family membrane protein n=1 Tax=Flavobacterium sp. RSSA_27 TaxID=3447667 RepID=UPI003F2DFA54